MCYLSSTKYQYIDKLENFVCVHTDNGSGCHYFCLVFNPFDISDIDCVDVHCTMEWTKLISAILQLLHE